ncbi:MAG: hypothetical protein GKR93_00005 [Gammaproteobacteria bacterium]|nr:hypothetical protein [Gammaproteobacteria bacterium]
MSKVIFKRPVHKQVQKILSSLDRDFLERSQCFFGGGTRIVLELGEYRESRDIDFLCANQEGYRAMRETVSANSLGNISSPEIILAREVRADQYGIRTFIESNGNRLKFEIIREARIELLAQDVGGISVKCLSYPSCFAEKFLVNADRGLDSSTLSRDVIDLAFMIENWPVADANSGLLVAEQAYGSSIRRNLTLAISKIRENKTYRKKCVDGLAVSNSAMISKGLKKLSRLIEE